MKVRSGTLVLAVIGMFMAPMTSVMSQYQDHSQISKKIEALGRQYPDLCSVKSLIKTTGGKDIWLITIGTGTRDSKPGVAVVGGVDGRYMIGRELAPHLSYAINLPANHTREGTLLLLQYQIKKQGILISSRAFISTAIYILTRSREPRWPFIRHGIFVKCLMKTNS